MQVWKTPADVPADLGGTALTLGIFDGVHKGHKAILAATVAIAKKQGLLPVALTFDPHPRQVHHPEQPLQLVTSLRDRLERLESAGIKAAYVQHYDLAYAQLSPEDFVRRQLVQELHTKAVIVGEDVRFGAGNAGDAAALQDLGAKYGIAVTIMPDRLAATGKRWSSTWVRELLASGDVRAAMQVLGRPHRIRGIVQHGFKRGRQLGFPTANLKGADLGEIPADGVYAGWLVRQVPSAGAQATEYLPAAISVGSNPQFAAAERTVEAHVLGRSDLNLYDQEIAIDFIERLRPMLKLDSVEQLQAQMDEDLRAAAEVLAVPVPSRINPAAVTAQ